MPMISDSRLQPEFPTWTLLPNMATTSKTGSNDGVEHDELTHDDDHVDQGHRVKRQKTDAGPVERSVDMEYSTIGYDSPGTSGGLAPSQVTIQPAFENRDVASLTLEDSHGTVTSATFPVAFSTETEDVQLPLPSVSSPLKIRIPPLRRRINLHLNQKANQSSSSRRLALLESSRRAHAHSFVPFGSISTATSSSFSLHTAYIGHQPHQIAGKASSTYAVPTGSTGYEATMDELEDWTHASVAPLVVGKTKYIKLPGKEEAARVRAINLRMLRNVSNQSQIAEGSSTPLPQHSWIDVATPVVSRSTQRKCLLKEIFGEESEMFSDSSTTAPSAGPSSRKSSISAGSTDPIILETNSRNLPSRKEEIPPNSVHLVSPHSAGARPSSPQGDASIQFSSLRKMFAFRLSDNEPQASRSTLTGGSNVVDNAVYPTGGGMASELQAQHSPRRDSLDGYIVANDKSVDPASPHCQTHEHSPIRHVVRHPQSATIMAEEDVVELVSPMVLELRNSSRNSPPPVDTCETETIFTLNPNSALAMQHNNPFIAKNSTWELRTKPYVMEQNFNQMNGFAQNTENRMNSNGQTDYLSEAPGLDYLATNSAGQTIVELPEAEVKTSPTFPSEVPITEDVSGVETELPAAETASTFPAEESITEDVSGVETELPAAETASTFPAEESTSTEDVYVIEEESRPHTPIPTIFDPAYTKTRSQDLWADDRHGSLGEWVNERIVIVEIREDLDPGYFAEESEEVEAEAQSEDEEADELESDQSESADAADLIGTPTKRGKVAIPVKNLSNTKVSDQQVSTHAEERLPANVPRRLARQIERWSQALHSLVKGKKRFQEQDIIALKDALQGVYDNHRHIVSTSSVADTVHTITKMRVGDIPGGDAIGLRAIARKCVRAWALQN